MTIAALLIALIATPNAEPKGEPVLLDFQASWCGPCRQMRPALEQLTELGYPIRSIDIDRSPELAERYHVKSVPTFIVVDASGRTLARTKGLQPAAELASFYRKARTKALPPAKPKTPAASDDEEAEAKDSPRDDAERDEPRPTKRTPPKPWETVVRIKVHGNGMIGFGSGTIVHSDPEESIILTCAHIFKMEGKRPVAPSQFPLRITIDLFDGKLTSLKPAQVHPIETVEGEAVDYDFARDVGLIRIRPGRRLAASPIVPASWAPRQGMRMTTVGCSLGQDATAWSTSIQHTLIRGLSGSPSYEAIECKTAPKQGRSGGGLYTPDGYVAGVCDFAEPQGDVGLYATPRSIYHILDRNRLTALYNPSDRASKALLAKNSRPTPKRNNPPSIARAQSPDDDDSKVVTIPRPEMLGITPPAVAQGRPRTSDRRPSWQSSQVSNFGREEEAESTDLKLSKDVDNDQFDAPAERQARTAEETPKTTPSRSLSRWRPVKSASPALAGASQN